MNIPKLRFKEFTDEWCNKKFDDLIDIKSNTYNPIKSNINYRCIELEHINQNSGTINGFINSNEQKSNKIFFKKGDVLFSKLRPYLRKYWLAEFDGVCSSEIWVAKSKNDKLINNKFIFDIFQSNYFLQLCNLSTGSKMPRADWTFIKEQSTPIPLLNEQLKIANFLNLLDKKIELQTEKIEALKLFKLSITQNIFNEKKSNDFQSVTLGKILKPGSKIPVKNTSEYEKLTVKLNFKGLAKLETKKEMADTRPFYVRNENEIIIGKQNYFNGSIAKVTKDFKGCICSNAIMSFTTINGVNVDYVLYYLSQKNYINRRKFLANGTGQKELSEKEFLKFVIKLPSTQIQNNISKKISCVSNLLLLENKKLTTLKNLKKGLLQNLFI